jgi:hypothetical protein
MKIEVTHVIKVDPQVVSLFSAFLGALGAPSQDIKAADAVEMVKTNPTKGKLEVPTVADKTMYFLHEGSGAAIVVKKGEDITFLENDIYDPISKAEYDKIQAEQAALVEKAKDMAKEQDANETTEQSSKDESDDHGITIEMVRAEAKKLASSGRQADLKAILTSFDAPKLTAVSEDKFPELLAAIKEAVGEE